MSAYRPVVGDRVRATRTVEGVITKNHDGHWSYVEVEAEEGGIELHDEERWSFEKLQDPEPEWVNGDVVEVKYYVPAHRIDGKWINPTTGNVHYFSTPSGVYEVPTAYTEGDLKILYKADAA